MTLIKEILRKILILSHLDVTKNIKYDRLTLKILKNSLEKNFNCIDIGCHRGEILNLMLKYSPKGKHYAFEPIPYLFKELEIRFKNKAFIFPYALSNKSGITTFQFVKNAPAYSGIRKRRYDIKNVEIEEIEVEMKALDEVLPLDEKINFIKIDVEGGEFDVLKGAKNLLIKNKPIILFECGKGASDYYGTTPADLFDFFVNEIGLFIYTLNDYIKREKPLSISKFIYYFDSNCEYYFIASKNKYK